MTAILDGVAPDSVPMTPDYSVRWERNEVPGGTLYRAPGCPADVAEKVIAMAMPDSAIFASASPVCAENSGSSGEVRALDGVAYKRAHEVLWEGAMGLSALRAGIALRRGLQDAGTMRPLVAADGASCFITTPEYYAGFIPDSRPGSRPGKPRQLWAMSLESGRTPRLEELPSRKVRQTVYEAAVRACGLIPDAVDFDDKINNFLISEDAGTRRIVKLDVQAFRNTKRLYKDRHTGAFAGLINKLGV